MATYPNPYATSPIGEALGRLGRVLTSGPSQANRVKAAEEALALKREREGITSLSELFGAPEMDSAAIARAGIMGGVSPNDVSGYGLYRTANETGADSAATDAAARGAGKAYSTTAQAFNLDQSNAMTRAANALAEDARQADARLAENRRQFDYKPMGAIVGGEARYVPQSGAFETGVAPVLSETQQKGRLLGIAFDNLDAYTPEQRQVLGANPTKGTPRNWITPQGVEPTLDGVTNAHTGQPLSAGGHFGTVTGSAEDTGVTDANKTRIINGLMQQEQLLGTIDRTRALVEGMDPSMFGASGNIGIGVTGMTNIAVNLAEGLGFEGPREAISAFHEKIRAQGEEPVALSGQYFPEQSELDTLYTLLTYSVASALAGQDGRDLSNEDVKRAQNNVGDPRSLFGDKRALLTKLDVIERETRARSEIMRRFLGEGPGQGAEPAAPTDARFTGDNFTPTQQSGPPQVSTEDEYNALPAGAEYIDPNGVRRRKGG